MKVIFVETTYVGNIPPSYEIWLGEVAENAKGKNIRDVLTGRRIAVFHETDDEESILEEIDADIKVCVNYTGKVVCVS
jgi:hypothetical protein